MFLPTCMSAALAGNITRYGLAKDKVYVKIKLTSDV